VRVITDVARHGMELFEMFYNIPIVQKAYFLFLSKELLLVYYDPFLNLFIIYLQECTRK
jgi:hypothetical protein